MTHKLCGSHVYEMVYALYKNLLQEYSAEKISFLGCSSGANLALGLISYINDRGEGLPMPGYERMKAYIRG